MNEAANVLAFHRWEFGGPHDDVVVVANLSAEARHGYTVGMPAAGHWRLKFNSDARTYSEVFGGFPSADTQAWPEERDGLPAHATIGIGPYSVLVYSRA